MANPLAQGGRVRGRRPEGDGPVGRGEGVVNAGAGAVGMPTPALTQGIRGVSGGA